MELIDDKKRINNFLEILPEETIESLSLEFSFGGGQYNDWVVDILRKYRDYNKRIGTHYINKEIEKKFKAFNNSFRKLYDFFNKNFVYAEIGGGLMRYSLLPKLREKAETEWIQKYREFYSLYQDFFNKYKRFLITTKKNLAEPKKITPEPMLKRKRRKKRKSKNKTIIMLYLEKNGDLYQEPKDKYCYSMGETDGRHKLIRLLNQYKGHYIPTETITEELKYQNTESTRNSVGQINKQIKKKMKAIKNSVVQGKPKSGYRINPKYEIFLKE